MQSMAGLARLGQAGSGPSRTGAVWLVNAGKTGHDQVGGAWFGTATQRKAVHALTVGV